MVVFSEIPRTVEEAIVYYKVRSSHSLEILRGKKEKPSVQTVHVLVKILTGHLTNIRQKPHDLGHPAGSAGTNYIYKVRSITANW
jgi:hypothetical protein